MPFLQNVRQQFSELLAQQSQTQKVLGALIVVAVIGLLCIPIFRLGKTVEYEVLYSDLSDNSASQIKKDLDQRGVPYKTYQDDRGWTVKVPKESTLDMRLELATTLDPMSDQPGWGLFERSALGETHFRAQVNKLRALQGELARTIASLDVVRKATVHLALPEKSVFVKDDAKPKASVLVDLYPQARMGEDQVATVQALVAGTIEGLDRESVTVADTQGNELSRVKEVPEEQEILDRRERLVRLQQRQKREYEQYLEDKIVGSFAQVFGPSNVAANVNVEFDFTVKEETELEYDPKSVVVAEARTVRGTGEAPRLVEGVVGTTRHVQDTDGGKSGGAEADKTYREEWVRNMNVGKKETRTVYAPYQIKRVTAAVLVDNPPIEQEDNEGNVSVTRSKPLSEEELTKLEEQVRQIINYSDQRPGGMSDEVSVTNMRFVVPEEITGVPRPRQVPMEERIKDYVRYGLLFLFGLAVLFLLWPMVRSLYAGQEEAALEGPGGVAALGGGARGLPSLEHPSVGVITDDSGQALPSPPPEAEDVLAARQKNLDQEILELARANPKKVPLVLRAWMEG